ncbi:hypothetical protein IU500_13890 [Nocardia terpenica]|uniref:Uncharacterized protein n=2 Tax=Nocardia terpenica TaxID=455432 RepID=A0A164IVF2_9NOCA|nr:hypothetical protein [Nocardia terpenica]KZM69783.1 hypothetical protein AWN90_07110 [Nocardia terpenica]MBF6062731.1 hypothetical protein [Nocardia terpenica]MBF6105134.1 hypothetical protein [Nocardia terpenica]MBF6112429.1 hypothetical protein [Nocardia terpenica]MBF6118862.1 hypothetical protein [Nocardia terpenica]
MMDGTAAAETPEGHPVSYRWEAVRLVPEGERTVLERGEGVFGAADPTCGRVCSNYVEVGTAVFDDVCEGLIAEHHADVLDARIEERADPEPKARQVRMVVFDPEGAERMTATARLSFREVTGKDLADYRKQLALWEKRENERRARRLRAVVAAGRPLPEGDEMPRLVPADPRLRGLISTLRVEADTVREEIYDLDHCREQLALAENTVAAARRAEQTARANGDLAEAVHARAYIDRWTPRIGRWASLLELTTEAYMDAAAVDDLADRLSLQPPIDN